MRTFRIFTQHGGRDLAIIDDETGVRIPDVLRVEFAPLNRGDAYLFGTVYVHRRGPDGSYLTDDADQPLTDRAFVRFVVATIWSV